MTVFQSRKIDRILTADREHAPSPDAVAAALPIPPDPRKAADIRRAIRRRGCRLQAAGRISSACYREIDQTLTPGALLQAAEARSPYHKALGEREFYNHSDPATRSALRYGLTRYARRHKLSPSEAALLWQGEMPAPSRLWAVLLLLPLLLLSAGLLPIFRYFPPVTAWLFLLTLPALFAGGYLIAAALLYRHLPPAANPRLEEAGSAHILTVCMGRLDGAKASVDTLARLVTAGEGDAFLLLLTLPDALIPEVAGEDEQIRAVQAEIAALAKASDSEILVAVLPRKFVPRKGSGEGTRYQGMPTLKEAAEAILHHIEGQAQSPDGICLLPAGCGLLPGSVSEMTAALFHPLCRAEGLTFLAPAASPLPLARLAVLRQCLLQKLHAPADHCGFGLYRREGLTALARGESIALRLGARPLLGAPDGALALVPRSFTLCRLLSATLPVLRAMLLLAAVAAAIPLWQVWLLWRAASADLAAAALLSLRWGKGFSTLTLPAWRQIGSVFLHRTLLPMASLPAVRREAPSLPLLAALSLGFGGLMIATGAPLSFLGICYCVLPLLVGDALPDQRGSRRLAPRQKAVCHRLAAELYPRLSSGEDDLPCAGEMPYTTPSTLGLTLAAEVAACDVGLIDRYTLYRRVDAWLTRLEALPTRCGLPYARYTPDCREFYGEGCVDSGEAGLFALCLGATEAGLLAHATRHPPLRTLAGRIAHLSAQADFTVLLDENRRICRRLTPDGRQEGVITHLFDGGTALFALLASDNAREISGTDQITAWNALRAPICRQGIHCLVQSERGMLADYLRTAFFLPADEGSLIIDGSRRAVGEVLRHSGRRSRRRLLTRLAGRIGGKGIGPLTSGAPALAAHPREKDAVIDPATLCLLLSFRPRLAIGRLPEAMQTAVLSPAEIALSLLALSGAVSGHGCGQRLMTLPRFAALAPLLTRHNPSEEILQSAEPPLQVSPRSPGLFLLGDSRAGLFYSPSHCLALWQKGRAITAPCHPAAPYVSGRLTGLLVAKAGKTSPLPATVTKRSPGSLTFADGGDSLCISAVAGGWTLCYTPAHPDGIDLRFVFCPAAERAVVWESACRQGTPVLGIDCAFGLTVALSMTGIDAPFAHADPSPLPRGREQADAIFALPPQPAGGTVQTPTVILGGRLSSRCSTLRIALAASRRAVMAILDSPPCPRTGDALLSLPSKPHGPAAALLEWQMRALCQGLPIPKAQAIGSAGSDRALLSRCLAEGEAVLTGRGFPLSDAPPIPLSLNRKEGAEGLITRLLADLPTEAQTPLLPPREEIGYPDGFAHILRGRDQPDPCRIYQNGIARLSASAEGLEFTPYRSAPTLPICLHLSAERGRILLPAAATTLTFAPGEAVFAGNGFVLRAALPPQLPLLILRIAAAGQAELAPGVLPPAYATEGDTPLHRLSDGHILFVRKWQNEEEQVILVGAFPKGQDRLYYHIGEQVTPARLPALLAQAEQQQQKAALLLTAEGNGAFKREFSHLPAVLAAILASPSPAKALLAPLATPDAALPALLHLALSPPTLLFPMAFALQFALSAEGTALAKLGLPAPGGRESLYLAAARVLERAMEEEPDHPLLPPLTASFAKIAARLGDHTGQALYAGFVPKAPHRTVSTALPSIRPATLELLADLQTGSPDAGEALLAALASLSYAPPPADAALLYCGLLFGLLGFTPASLGEGFTLAPLAVKRKISFCLAYRGRWQIDLAPSRPPICSALSADPRPAYPTPPSLRKTEKIRRRRKISLQNSCILHKNGVK